MKFVRPLDKKSSWRALLAALWVMGAVPVGTSCGPSGSRSNPAQRQDEQNYLHAITFTDARLSAAQNFLGDTVTYLDARVSNGGSRVVNRLEIQLEFHDALKQVVLREKAYPLNPRTAPLKPGEARSFRATFEHLPAEWDGLLPTLTPTRVEF